MKIKKTVKKIPITFVEINGVEVKFNSLYGCLEELEDTGSFMGPYVEIYNIYMENLLRKLGIIDSTIRGKIYCKNQEKRKALLKKLDKLSKSDE
ncbi:hypothetical protein LCGC14_1621810 [marine sediment metagenome]|uniref:Uncharacterized protein n=1 Tax=marine sediment metagenome TaxID=412755 RepID=A0A0F9L5A5_9ZZZZ